MTPEQQAQITALREAVAALRARLKNFESNRSAITSASQTAGENTVQVAGSLASLVEVAALMQESNASSARQLEAILSEAAQQAEKVGRMSVDTVKLEATVLALENLLKAPPPGTGTGGGSGGGVGGGNGGGTPPPGGIQDRPRRIRASMIGASAYQGETVVMEFGAALEAARPGDVIEHTGGRQLGYFARAHPLNPAKMLGFERVLTLRSGRQSAPIKVTVAPGARVIHDGSELPNGQRLNNRRDGKEIYHPSMLFIGGLDESGEILSWWTVERWGVYNSLGYGVRMQGHNMSASLGWGEGNHAEPFNLGGDSYDAPNSPRFQALEPRVTACGGVRNASYRNGGDSADAVKVAHSMGGVLRACLGGLNSDDVFDGISADRLLLEECAGFGSGFYRDEAGRWVDAPTGNGQGFKLGGSSSHSVTVRRSVMLKAQRIGFTDNGAHDVDIIECREALSGNGSYNIKCDATDSVINSSGTSRVANQGRKLNECPDGAPGEVVGFTLLLPSDYRSLDVRSLPTGDFMALTDAGKAKCPAEARWEWSPSTLALWRELIDLHKIDLASIQADLEKLPG